MADDLAILQQMILTSATVPLSAHAMSGKPQIVLTEKTCAGSKVTIDGVPNDCIVIKVDGAFPEPTKLFANTRHECKRADFAIFAKVGEKTVVILVEMKGGGGDHVVPQLKGAACAVAYCKEVGSLFWNEPGFLDKAEFRYVAMRCIAIPKRQTGLDNSAPLHNRPDRPLPVRQNRVQFNQLARAKA
jgi:hypothetical protein